MTYKEKMVVSQVCDCCPGKVRPRKIQMVEVSFAGFIRPGPGPDVKCFCRPGLMHWLAILKNPKAKAYGRKGG